MNPQEMQETKAGSGVQDFVLLFLLFCSLSLNVYFASHWKAQAGKSRSFPGRESSISVGGPIRSMMVIGPDGTNAILHFEGTQRPSILYYFSPSCIWCERNLDSIRTLVRATHNSYAFYGISVSDAGLQEYVRQSSLPFAVYSLDKQTKNLPLPSATPTTIVIDTAGTVIRKWDGAFLDKNKMSIEEYFGLRLPNIAKDQQ